MAINFRSKFCWKIVRGNDSFYRRFQRICNFREKIIPNEKKFDLASFYYYCVGISSDYFYFFICKVKVKKIQAFSLCAKADHPLSV